MNLATKWHAVPTPPQVSSADDAPGGRPFIILPGGNVSITAAAEKIFGLIKIAGNLFYRGGRVHEITAEPDGRHRLVPITATRFRSLVEAYGQLLVLRSGANCEPVLKPTLCPEETAKALLESPPAGNLLPNIAILSACPVLVCDGGGCRMLTAGWHDHGGGIYISGGIAPPVVPLDEAVASLSALLGDFDFASPGDRSRALASLISPALRFGGYLKKPLPVDIGEADASQSGKTYRQKLVAALYREIPNVVVQRTGGVGGIDESISQKLVDGRPFVLLDNLRGKLDSPFLEAILTAPGSMPARIPHKGEIQVDARSFVFQMTSNGVETTRDLANRATIIRIRKRPAEYNFVAYPEGDLFDHVFANQPYYLGGVFAVITAWVAQGMPRTVENRHDFREWAQALDWIVQNLFAAAPLLDGHAEAHRRVSDPGRTWLRVLCIKFRDSGRTGEITASGIAEFAAEQDMLPPGVREEDARDRSPKVVGKIMAAVFGDTILVEIDGFKIHRIEKYNPTFQKKGWVYHFGEFQTALPMIMPLEETSAIPDNERPY